MDTYSWVLISGFVVFGIVLSAVVITFHRSSEKKFEETIANALRGPEIRWDGKQTAFQYGEMQCRYERFAGSKNSPPSFSVFAECAGTGGEFEVARESAWERFFKRLGMTREVQTGDELFDQRYYIASNTPGFAREYFASAERREAVKRLLGVKNATFSHKGKALRITWTGSASHAEGAANLKESVECLAVLARDMPVYREPVPSFQSSESTPAQRIVVMAGTAVLSGLGMLGVIGTVMFYPVFDPWGFFVSSLKFSLSALALYLFYAVRALAGHSRSHRDILIAGFLALTGFPVLGCGAAGLYNGMADAAAPATHTAVVVDKQASHSRRSSSYHLYVRSWRAGQAIESFPVSSAVFQKVVPGKDRIAVVTKPGKLGFEWQVAMQVL